MQSAVLLTGSTGGIGRASLVPLIERGFVVYAGVRSAQAGESIAREFGDKVIPVELDVTNAEQIRAAAEAISRSNMRFAGLVNSAGFILQGPVELLPPDRLREQFEVNVIGTIAVTQAVLPFLRRDSGRIVTVGAISARLTAPMIGAIAASKGALALLNDSLRMELARSGIRVVLIEPGGMNTEIFANARRDWNATHATLDEERRALYARQLVAFEKIMSSRRLSSPRIVARAIVRALTSPNSPSRMVVGGDARMFEVLRRLPRGVRDDLIRRATGFA